MGGGTMEFVICRANWKTKVRTGQNFHFSKNDLHSLKRPGLFKTLHSRKKKTSLSFNFDFYFWVWVGKFFVFNRFQAIAS